MADQIANFRYDTWELDAIVNAVLRPEPFLLAKFFPTPLFFESAAIEFDIVEGGRRLAPFVTPLTQGRPIKSRGYSTAQITPAYIKPLSTVTPQQGFVRQAGEAYGGSMTPRQRVDRLVANAVVEHRDMIDNRLEWMAAKALQFAEITIAGDDYPSKVVSFGQHADLTVTLGGSVEWDDTNGDPAQDIEDLALAINTKSYGAVADTVVMDGLAWKLFRNKMSTNKLFDTTLRLSDERTRIDGTPRNTVDGVLQGRLGKFDIWTYDAAYEDDAGASAKFLTDYNVILGGPGIEGRQYFGAIQDMAGMSATKQFVKTWDVPDPSGVNVLSQSAPLVAPRRPNAYGCILAKG